jgi:hypothetical protein
LPHGPRSSPPILLSYVPQAFCSARLRSFTPLSVLANCECFLPKHSQICEFFPVIRRRPYTGSLYMRRYGVVGSLKCRHGWLLSLWCHRIGGVPAPLPGPNEGAGEPVTIYKLTMETVRAETAEDECWRGLQHESYTRSGGCYAAHGARREAPKMLCAEPSTGCVEHFGPHWQRRACYCLRNIV